jgi:hypothetical protein
MCANKEYVVASKVDSGRNLLTGKLAELSETACEGKRKQQKEIKMAPLHHCRLRLHKNSAKLKV